MLIAPHSAFWKCSPHTPTRWRRPRGNILIWRCHHVCVPPGSESLSRDRCCSGLTGWGSALISSDAAAERCLIRGEIEGKQKRGRKTLSGFLTEESRLIVTTTTKLGLALYSLVLFYVVIRNILCSLCTKTTGMPWMCAGVLRVNVLSDIRVMIFWLSVLHKQKGEWEAKVGKLKSSPGTPVLSVTSTATLPVLNAHNGPLFCRNCDILTRCIT